MRRRAWSIQCARTWHPPRAGGCAWFADVETMVRVGRASVRGPDACDDARWSTEQGKEAAPAEPVKKTEGEWSDEEEEEEDEDEKTRIQKLRQEKEELKKRLSEIEEQLPMEQPKESKKAGKQMAALIKKREAEERRRAEEQLLADQQVSLQRKIEESDFENAQDMFGGGGGANGAAADSGKFESWPLTNASKQKDVEEFAQYAADKMVKFKDEFLYITMLRKLLMETAKSLDPNQCKELLLVLTKGRTDFTVVDLVRFLLRDADKDIAVEDIEALMQKTSVDDKKKPAKGKDSKQPLTSRQMLLKLLLHDFVRDTKPEDMGRIIEEGCGVILTRDQQGKIATKRAELQGDPNSKVVGKGNTRVAEHKSLAMYDAFGSGGGEGWGGGGGTRGDDYDFM
eukprot:Tamp_06978.p2 GENE.Tamp_06978~~Tamp_06978.p2  ORF type:complete len:398 (+),score=145.30 Tamp_06978:469-1662(+)